MWSCGVILYVLLCGFPPFYADHDGDLYELIRTGSYSFPSPYWDDVSDNGASRLTVRVGCVYSAALSSLSRSRSLAHFAVSLRCLCAAKDLIRRMLVVDAAARFTPQQVLQHPFVTNYRSLSFTRTAGLSRELSLHLVTQKMLKKVCFVRQWSEVGGLLA